MVLGGEAYDHRIVEDDGVITVFPPNQLRIQTDNRHHHFFKQLSNINFGSPAFAGLFLCI